MNNAKVFLDHYLGEDGLETLAKSGELFKETTATALDYDEIYKATQIVPKTVLALLHRNLHGLKENEHTTFSFKPDSGKEAQIYAQKFSGDNYSGNISREGKVLARFKNRSLPGVGIIVLSTFELYDFQEPEEKKEEAMASVSIEGKIEKIIEERLALHAMVRKVVDEAISKKDALELLIGQKVSLAIKEKEDKMSDQQPKKQEEPKQEPPKKSGSKLKDFLNSRKKMEKSSAKIFMVKSEADANCPDCGQVIFKSGKMSGCICCGENKNAKIFIKKSQKGMFEVRFSKDWDPENIAVLLETFRKKNGGL